MTTKKKKRAKMDKKRPRFGNVRLGGDPVHVDEPRSDAQLLSLIRQFVTATLLGASAETRTEIGKLLEGLGTRIQNDVTAEKSVRRVLEAKRAGKWYRARDGVLYRDSRPAGFWVAQVSESRERGSFGWHLGPVQEAGVESDEEAAKAVADSRLRELGYQLETA